MINIVMMALKIASEAHKDQIDKAGRPYILHPLTVACKATTEDECVAGLLHDVVEDSSYTFDDLRMAGIPEHIIEALRLLTHDKKVAYMDYISKIKGNDLARAVKLADLEHNSDLSRLTNITDTDRERITKYKQAVEYLQRK